MSRARNGDMHMTIGVQRTIRIADDPKAALTFAKDMATHIKKWNGVTRSVVFQALGGPVGTLVFFSECEDLAAYDRISTQMAEDQVYWSKITEARTRGLFDLSTAQDVVLRQL
jgi:hypothetical protein